MHYGYVSKSYVKSGRCLLMPTSTFMARDSYLVYLILRFEMWRAAGSLGKCPMTGRTGSPCRSSRKRARSDNPSAMSSPPTLSLLQHNKQADDPRPSSFLRIATIVNRIQRRGNFALAPKLTAVGHDAGKLFH